MRCTICKEEKENGMIIQDIFYCDNCYNAMPHEMATHNYNVPLPSNPYNPLAWIDPKAKIGMNSWIGSDTYIGPNVVLGDNVSVANGCKIFDHDMSYHRVSEGRVEFKHYNVVIGAYTQLGANAVILPKDTNIIIGDHVIVGALALVRESIPSFSVAVGAPARVIKRIKCP